MIKGIALSLLVAAPLPVPAVAVPTDSQGQQARIAVQQAEEARTLESVTRQTPYDGGAFVELAAAYVRAGRPADAATAARDHRDLARKIQIRSHAGCPPCHDAVAA
mgnify:CR=1 FL=1